jgi:hypothetical protein
MDFTLCLGIWYRFLLFWGWVESESLRSAATNGLIVLSRDDVWKKKEPLWNGFWFRQTEALRKKTVPVPLRPPQIPGRLYTGLWPIAQSDIFIYTWLNLKHWIFTQKFKFYDKLKDMKEIKYRPKIFRISEHQCVILMRNHTENTFFFIWANIK